MNNEKQSLGYIYSFKESSLNILNQIAVLHRTGISKEYPQNLENKKNIAIQEIFEGDFEDIYIDKKKFIQQYNSEFKNRLLSHDQVEKEGFIERQYLYNDKLSEKQYMALRAFEYVQAYTMKDFISIQDKKETLKETIGKVFNKDNIDELYQEHIDISLFLYHKNIELALSDKKPIKIKMF